MGLSCSKTKPEEIIQPSNNNLAKMPSRKASLNEQFMVEKVDYNFVSTGFGTKEPDKWDLECISEILGAPIKSFEEFSELNCSNNVDKPFPVSTSDGCIYFGNWKDNSFEGKGLLLMSDGSQYVGNFFEGKFNGPGEILYPNGDAYKGMFLAGKKHGKGILKFKNGDVFEGMWTNGSRHGYGVERFSDGTVFMGNFRNNKRSGHGELRKSDGVIYEGHFNNNLITGFGKMRWPNGETYTGGFKNGLKHGNGTTMWKSGKYVSHKGVYNEGKMSGNFRSVKRDGTVVDALYENDELVKYLTEEDSNQPNKFPVKPVKGKSPASSNDTSLSTNNQTTVKDGESTYKPVSKEASIDDVTGDVSNNNPETDTPVKSSFDSADNRTFKSKRFSVDSGNKGFSNYTSPQDSRRQSKTTFNHNGSSPDGLNTFMKVSKYQNRDFSNKYQGFNQKTGSFHRENNGQYKIVNRKIYESKDSNSSNADETQPNPVNVDSSLSKNENFVKSNFRRQYSRGRFPTRPSRGRRGQSRGVN